MMNPKAGGGWKLGRLSFPSIIRTVTTIFELIAKVFIIFTAHLIHFTCRSFHVQWSWCLTHCVRFHDIKEWFPGCDTI